MRLHPPRGVSVASARRWPGTPKVAVAHDREGCLMGERLHRFLRDESGPELVEWAVVTLVLLLATGVILSQIYDQVIQVMVGILQQLTR